MRLERAEYVACEGADAVPGGGVRRQGPLSIIPQLLAFSAKGAEILMLGVSISICSVLFSRCIWWKLVGQEGVRTGG